MVGQIGNPSNHNSTVLSYTPQIDTVNRAKIAGIVS